LSRGRNGTATSRAPHSGRRPPLLKDHPGPDPHLLVASRLQKQVILSRVGPPPASMLAVAGGRRFGPWGPLSLGTTDVLPKLSPSVGLLREQTSLSPRGLARVCSGSGSRGVYLDADLRAGLAHRPRRWSWSAVWPILTRSTSRGRPHRPSLACWSSGCDLHARAIAGPISWDHYPTWGIPRPHAHGRRGFLVGS